MGATVLSYPGDSIPEQSSFKRLTYLPAEFLGRLGEAKIAPFSVFLSLLKLLQGPPLVLGQKQQWDCRAGPALES